MNALKMNAICNNYDNNNHFYVRIFYICCEFCVFFCLFFSISSHFMIDCVQHLVELMPTVSVVISQARSCVRTLTRLYAFVGKVKAKCFPWIISWHFRESNACTR